MEVTFTRCSLDGFHEIRVRRGDGVGFSVRGSGRKGFIPHDMGHFVIDQAFGVFGFWGCVAEGALFKSLTLVEGKLRHDARPRSDSVLKRHADDLRLSEAVVGGPPYAAVEQDLDIEQAFKHLLRSWGSIRSDPMPYDRAVLARTIEAVRVARNEWAAVPVGEAMTLTWHLNPAGSSASARRGHERAQARRLAPARARRR